MTVLLAEVDGCGPLELLWPQARRQRSAGTVGWDCWAVRGGLRPGGGPVRGLGR